QTRLHALWSLEGLGALSEADLARALADEKVPVRVHALRLAESRLDTSTRPRDQGLNPGASGPRVRFQLAFTPGATQDPRAVAVLARLARESAGDPWIRTAVLSSASETSGELLVALLGERGDPARAGSADFVASLASVLGSRKRPAELGRVFSALAE